MSYKTYFHECRNGNAEKEEKYRLFSNQHRRKYYAQTAIYGRNEWTQEQERMVLERKTSDRELSQIIHHSVEAIQKKRWKLLHLDENGKRIKTVEGGAEIDLY